MAAPVFPQPRVAPWLDDRGPPPGKPPDTTRRHQRQGPVILLTIGAFIVGMVVAVTAVNNSSHPGPALAPPPALASQNEIARLFDQWNAALAIGDPEKVADLYAPNAVLLPTLSYQIRTNRAEIVDYFTHFLQSKPQGRIDRAIITVIDPQTAINTGIYTFTLTQDGQPQNVQARYTFAYQKQNGNWLIVNHHSSKMPEPVPTG